MIGPNISKLEDRAQDLPNVAGMTLREIGERWGGISGSRARQVIDKIKRVAAVRTRQRAAPHPLTDEWLLADLPLSPRTHCCLHNDGITTVGAVRGMTNRELMSIPNFGRKSLHELRGIIREGFTPRPPTQSASQ
jgi:hypothetical protein